MERKNLAIGFVVAIGVFALIGGFIVGFFTNEFIPQKINAANKVMDGIDQESAEERNLVYFNFYSDFDSFDYDPDDFWTFRINDYIYVRAWYPFEDPTVIDGSTIITFVVEKNHQKYVLDQADITGHVRPGDIVSYYYPNIVIQHAGYQEMIEMDIGELLQKN